MDETSLTLLIGGARSGKTALAVDLARRYAAGGGAVTYLATAPAVDADMEQRIARHRRERPAEWVTIEAELDIAAALQGATPGMVILDCLTLWTSNLIWHDLADDEIRVRAETSAAAAAGRRGPIVAITNEVGLGIVPDNAVARRYRDIHGWVNQTWAARATTVLHMVAGRAVRLDDPRTLLDELR